MTDGVGVHGMSDTVLRKGPVKSDAETVDASPPVIVVSKGERLLVEVQQVQVGSAQASGNVVGVPQEVVHRVVGDMAADNNVSDNNKRRQAVRKLAITILKLNHIFLL